MGIFQRESYVIHRADVIMLKERELTTKKKEEEVEEETGM